jgi:outer membrane protein
MLRTIALCFLLLLPAAALGQPITPIGASNALSLDEAIQLALRHNRLVRNDELEVEKASERVEIARTRRLPQFDLDLLGLQTLTPVEFRFNSGSLGTLPGGAPFPLQDIRIRSPRHPNLLLTARATQPLTQLPRINLGIRLQETNRELTEAKLESQRRAVANQVKRSYYAVLQTESALRAIEESLKLRRELDRVVGEYVVQKVALTSDSLDVKTSLAHDEYEATKLRNAMAAQKEQLNLLLGRDVRTEFRTSPTPENVIYEFDPDAARERAIAERGEIKEARLKLKMAEYTRRIKKSEALPDVSLTFGYFSSAGFAILPVNVAAIGVSVKWEPFDWGRKKRELAEIRKTIDQADNALREAEAQVVLDVNARFRKLEEARALLRVTEAAQTAAQEKLRVATNKYKLEAALFKDVLQTQAGIAETNHQHQQALLAFLTARADFEKAIGGQ